MRIIFYTPELNRNFNESKQIKQSNEIYTTPDLTNNSS